MTGIGILAATMRSRVIAASVGAAVLLGTSASNGYAAAQPAASPKTVQLTTARGDAPALQPGMYQASRPQGETERYATITRPKDASVTVAIFGAVDAKLTTPDGDDDCSDTTSNAGDAVTGYKFVYVDGDETKRQTYLPDACKSATKLILQVSAGDDEDGDSSNKPLQLAVTIEPKLADTGTPATTTQLSKLSAPSRSTTGKDRVLSQQLYQPTTLEPDSYPVTLKPGQLAVARVRVGWNQRLAVSVDAPRNGTNFAPPASLNVAAGIFSPQWAPVGGDSTLLFEKQSTEETATAYTAPVRAGNRNLDYTTNGDVSTSSGQWATAAGWYYVILRVGASSTDEKLPTTTPVPARLNIKLVGATDQGPKYADVDGAAEAAPPATQLSQGGSDGSGFTTGKVLQLAGTIIVLVLAGGLVVLLLRRRTA